MAPLADEGGGGVGVGWFGAVATWLTCKQRIISLNEYSGTTGHFSLIPTSPATFFLPLALGCGGERCPACLASLAAVAASAACCQHPSRRSTTQRTTHFRFRQRYRTFSAKRSRRFSRST